jgi:membrane fusion protein, multidrug efflux system
MSDAKVRTRKGLAIRAGIVAAAVLVVILIGVLTIGEDKKETQAPQSSLTPSSLASPVSVITVTPTPITDILILPGQTEPRHDITLSAERGGRVEWVGPEEGDTVKKGEVLAEIDLTALKSALDRAEASFELTQKQAKRREDLLSRNVVAEEELDKAETDLRVAESNLREARVNYRQGKIISPIAGLVDRLHVDRGEYVKPGTPVAEIVDVDSIEVLVNVPEMDVRYLKKDMQALVSVDAHPYQEWTGAVDFLAYKADFATKTFLAKVVVGNSDRLIRPGMLARVRFERRAIPNALTVPLFAVMDRGGERIVYVVEDGVARSRTVTPGVIDRDKVQILKGLFEGDRVIVAGQANVDDGMKVVVQ